MKSSMALDMEKFKISNVHVLADFDRTLTKLFVNGKRSSSMISVLRSEEILGKNYSRQAQVLYDHYSKFENDSSLAESELSEKMEEWWQKHYQLLKEVGLNKKHIEQVLESKQLEFREGVGELLTKLDQLDVPMVIISASGLGVEPIEKVLAKNDLLFDNIFTISNRLKWDKDGKFVDVEDPIVHIANKGKTILQEFPKVWQKIRDRKDVILIGDSLRDVDMVKGFDYHNLVKFGLLNEDVEELGDRYSQSYDVVIKGDGSLKSIVGFINRLNTRNKD